MRVSKGRCRSETHSSVGSSNRRNLRLFNRRSRDRARDRGGRGREMRVGAYVFGVGGLVDLPERLGAALERLGIERGRDGLRIILGASRGGRRDGGGTRGARAHRHVGAEALDRGSEHGSRPVRVACSSRENTRWRSIRGGLLVVPARCVDDVRDRFGKSVNYDCEIRFSVTDKCVVIYD